MPSIPRQTFTSGLDAPISYAVAVTPSDSADLADDARVLYVGGAGSLKVTPVNNADDAPVTFPSVAVGWFPVRVKRVWATGTTATGIIAGL